MAESCCGELSRRELEGRLGGKAHMAALGCQGVPAACRPDHRGHAQPGAGADHDPVAIDRADQTPAAGEVGSTARGGDQFVSVQCRQGPGQRGKIIEQMDSTGAQAQCIGKRLRIDQPVAVGQCDLALLQAPSSTERDAVDSQPGAMTIEKITAGVGQVGEALAGELLGYT